MFRDIRASKSFEDDNNDVQVFAQLNKTMGTVIAVRHSSMVASRIPFSSSFIVTWKGDYNIQKKILIILGVINKLNL